MPLLSRDSVQTLDYTKAGQPVVILEAKSLSSGTLDYTLRAEPITGLAPAAAVPVSTGNFLLMF